MARVSADHLYLHHCFVAVVQQVARFALIDPDNAKQQLTTQSQSHRRLVRRYDGLHAVCDIGLEDVIFRKLALEVGREPHASQRPAALQQRL